MSEPGSWVPGGSMDWVGILVERVGGSHGDLREYFKAHIFNPLEPMSTDFYAPPDKEVPLFFKDRRDNLQILSRPVLEPQQPEPGNPHGNHHMYSGAFGLRSSAKHFASLVVCLLNAGVYFPEILPPKYIAEMFRPQLGPGVISGHDKNVDRFHRQHNAMPTSANYDLSLKPENPHMNSGLGFVLQTTDRVLPGSHLGRCAGSGYWSGDANTNWWYDHKMGIAVVLFTSMFPFEEPSWVAVRNEFEKVLYAELRESRVKWNKPESNKRSAELTLY